MSSGVPSRRLTCPPRRVRGDPDVQCLALPDSGIERAHRLLEWCLGVDPMRVEDVDVLEPQSTQALIQAGHEVLARSVIAVRSWPHVVAGLARDHQLVTVRPQVRSEDPPEVRLRRAVRRAVVVGQVEMGDPAVERAPDDGPLGRERPIVAEVLPEAE